MKEDLIKSAPPIGVTGLELFGIPAPDIVQALTIVWLTVLIIDKVCTAIANYLEKKNGKGHCIPPSRSAPDRDGGID